MYPRQTIIWGISAGGKNMENKNTSKKGISTLALVETGVLTAIILIMAFTPIGYLKVGLLSISLITIPVAIGAIAISPAAGAFLGFVFGITSFIQCFTGDAFGAALVSINPFYTFVVCVPTRTVAGFLAGLVFLLLKRIFKKGANYVGGFAMAFFNTALFMPALVAFFWNADVVQGWAESLGTTKPFAFILASITLNAVIEWVSTTVIAGSVGIALGKVLNRQTAKPAAERNA